MARRSHDCHVPNRSGGANQTSPRHSSWEIALPSAWGDLLGFPDALHPWEPSPYPPIGPRTAEIPISTTRSHSRHATRVSRAPRPTVRLVHRVRGFPLIRYPLFFRYANFLFSLCHPLPLLPLSVGDASALPTWTPATLSTGSWGM